MNLLICLAGNRCRSIAILLKNDMGPEYLLDKTIILSFLFLYYLSRFVTSYFPFNLLLSFDVLWDFFVSFCFVSIMQEDPEFVF